MFPVCIWCSSISVNLCTSQCESPEGATQGILTASEEISTSCDRTYRKFWPENVQMRAGTLTEEIFMSESLGSAYRAWWFILTGVLLSEVRVPTFFPNTKFQVFSTFLFLNSRFFQVFFVPNSRYFHTNFSYTNLEMC